MADSKMRVIVTGFDYAVVEEAVARIIKAALGTNAEVRGPIPMPTKREIFTILRAVHKYKDSREQFERRTHKRLIDVLSPTKKTMETLTRLDMPAGVEIEIKVNAA